MALSRSKKEDILQKLVDSFGSAKSVVFAKNTGLSVAEIKELRSELRKENISFTVAKKTLFEKAAEQNSVKGFDITTLEGAIGVAVSPEDEVLGAKLIASFAKKNDKIELVAGIVEGNFLNTAEVGNLSQLPSKEELYAKMLGSMQAPLSGFVGVGNNLIGGLTRCLDQVREQKESS